MPTFKKFPNGFCPMAARGGLRPRGFCWYWGLTSRECLPNVISSEGDGCILLSATDKFPGL